METIIKIVQFLLSLSLLVIVHEMGHFFAARLFGIRVEKFYIFFNPRFSLLKFRRGGTEYGLGWIPLGGYVKIAGMIDESLDTEQMAAPPKPDEFRSKPAWQRLIVMVAGVAMNVLLAIAIYCGICWHWGEDYMPAEDARWGYVWNDDGKRLGFEDGDRIISIGGNRIEDMDRILTELFIAKDDREVVVERGGELHTITVPLADIIDIRQGGRYRDFMTLRVPFVIDKAVTPEAQAAGLRGGDRLVAFDGTPAEYFDEYRQLLDSHKGELVTLTVERADSTLPVTVRLSETGTIGVTVRSPFTMHTRHYSLAEAIPAGIRRTGSELGDYWRQLKLIFSPRSKMYREVGGFISIGSVFPAEWSWEKFWHNTALLSIMLAVMNILPIPALDGGHVLFLLCEVVTRRKPSDRFLEYAQMLGMLFILFLFIYANGNDVLRYLSRM